MEKELEQKTAKKETLREVEEKFNVRDTPENRMTIHRRAMHRQSEIATEIVNILHSEELTVRGAISILKDVENIIMQSRFDLE